MATDLEIRERQKNHLGSLLKIKGSGNEAKVLENEIKTAILGMNQEDIAFVEKITGVKAL